MTVADTYLRALHNSVYAFPGIGKEISRARPALPYPARMLQGRSDRHQVTSNLTTVTFLTPGRQVPQASATGAASLGKDGKGQACCFRLPLFCPFLLVTGARVPTGLTQVRC
jgi:hypothetical protein